MQSQWILPIKQYGKGIAIGLHLTRLPGAANGFKKDLEASQFGVYIQSHGGDDPGGGQPVN